MDVVRKPPRTTKTAVMAALAATALVGVGGSFWRSSGAAAPSVARSSVWTERVHRGDLLRQVPVQGTLVPEHVQWLSAVSAARVARITVRPGAQVEADSVVVVLENAELELAALEAERQAASADSALIQLDVKTHAEAKLQESTLAGLRSELRDAERHALAAGQLAPEGLMSALDHRDAQNKVTGLGERVDTEDARRQILETGRDRQIGAQRAEVERLREIARFRRQQLAALQVRAGIRGVVQDIPLESGQWVAIEDDGAGVSATANLFVPFFTTKPGGSGIGLALAQQIAEAHGGGVVLRTREHGGAEAIVRLPIRAATL